ncbi:response regulator [Algoriphagus vanfongensis]|uniref:response regulator n=1 Tax=Algoriphagus vanfongensis TaxID=426371 RepID=UPI0004213D59|nr:response regulator [Algoriphagus vanfongensis]
MIQFDAIFLVDDDPINNLINKRILQKVEITNLIQEFLEGAEALSKIENLDQEHQLLIFLDINMPVMNGWEFLEHYLAKFPQRQDKIVILSSSIDFQDRQKAQEYKVVTGFLEKPLTLDKIHQQLGKYQS